MRRRKHKILSSIHSSDHELTPSGHAGAAVRGRLKGDALTTFEHGRAWERCSVTTIYPKTHTCDVYTERGKLLTGLAWPGLPTVINPPGVGESLLVHFQAGTGILQKGPPMVSIPPSINRAISHGPGAAETTNVPVNDPSQPNFAGKGPTDVLPGDYAIASPTGNYIGVLRGGVNTMKSGEFSKVETHQEKELVRLVGRVIQMFAGAGSVVLDNEDGKTSLVFQIGADEGAESNPHQENFRIRYSAGQRGNLSDFRVTDGKGKTVYSAHVFPDGRSERESLSDNQILTEDKRTTARDHFDSGRNFAGEFAQEVNFRAGAKLRLRSLGRMSLNSINNMSFFSGNNMSLTSGNTLSVKANGPLIPLPINEAMKFDATNGSVVFDIGNPLSGDTGLVNPGFLVDTLTGDTRFTSLSGGFSVDSVGQVKLGGPPLSFHPFPVLPHPTSRAIVHDRFMAAIAALALELAVHQHPSPAGGLTLPPAPGTLMSPATIALFEAAQSLFVSFGG